jgi:methylthioribulose-1-phosphate dehydratase
VSELERGLIHELIDTGRRFYARGWVMGTSGNFSAVVSRDPLQLVITASGVDKGSLTPEQFVTLNPESEVYPPGLRPSAEVALHRAIVQCTAAQSVLHTHSVFTTLLTTWLKANETLRLYGYEMLKGLSGVRTHEHTEWVPILENSQDYAMLAHEFRRLLTENPTIHCILLRRHGLYTWGTSIEEARRHVEILEFLLEVYAREHALQNKLA